MKSSNPENLLNPTSVKEQKSSNHQFLSSSITANTRHSDAANELEQFSYPTLPKIDWEKIGKKAPVRIPIGKRSPNDPLPLADWVVITWTAAEWQAFNHVFLDSQSAYTGSEWKKDWHLYSRGASEFVADKKSGTLWGNFQLVQITDESGRPWRVLLFKSNTHLAHSPWIPGLSEMMRCILTDTKADRVYTIGTAGGARLTQSLGDSVITNCATMELQRPQNTSDNGNGNSWRCPSWYPSTSLTKPVQDNLLYPLSDAATIPALENLLQQLKQKHPGDPVVQDLKLEDLTNEGLNQERMRHPEIQSLEDVPLLTTDFYYIAIGDSADAFAFLEMDDAVIAREANALGVRFACVRNISDPIVPNMTKSGAVISDTVRGDWSGLIYSTFGLYTSFNGALATWATIAGEGSSVYHPARFIKDPIENDPIEVKLVYDVRSCGTCKFFWPDDIKEATYGPYTAFDFDVDIPYISPAPENQVTSPWTLGRTRPPSFPNGEVIDGCRKAPIMTIGINPNLTAFLPGQNGAAWAYPNFSSDNFTDAWTKYAWYYRYRSVWQEKLSLDFVKRFILPEGQVIAQRDGYVVSTSRLDENPAWSIKVRYSGYADDTTINIPGTTGDFPYMLFFDTFEPNNKFSAGDVLAGKVAVPEGIQVEILQEQQGYYMQFVPVLDQFEHYLKELGLADVDLKVGEDVSQVDMVACASPHWQEGYLGNQMETVVDNCVSKNAWVFKQLVQSKPAVLYIVSESTWNMFHAAVGKFVEPGKISEYPADQSFTLLRETTDQAVYLNFDFTVDGIPYKSRTRIVITPHFSFSTNFLPQYRLSPDDFNKISAEPDFAEAITVKNGFTILDADPKHPTYYREIQLQTATASESRAHLKSHYPSLYAELEKYYYDPHALMSQVLINMYDNHEISYDDVKKYLNRTEDACHFCVNQHWQFPNECRYGKTSEQSPPPGYLEKVAAYVVENGKVEKKYHSPSIEKVS